MLIEIWREAENFFSPITSRKSIQEKRIELTTGGVIEFWSLDNPDVIRGRKYKRWILDEWSVVPNAMDIWQMIIRPTLVDWSGDAWIFGTPKGKNAFWKMYQWGQDELNTEWASWQLPTSLNPMIPASEIQAMQRSMPQRIFEQEILAMFMDDAGGVFRRVVDATTAVSQNEAIAGHDYVVGVDLAKHFDFTVFTVIDIKTNEVVCTDRFNQIDLTVQLNRLKALNGRFKPVTNIIETNFNEMFAENARLVGLPVQEFRTTNATKQAAVDSLAFAFERGEIKIPNDPILIGELQAYEMERLASGAMRYNAPSGMHDDMVMSLALAWHGASYGQKDAAWQIGF